jgi:hypothetical protein
MQNKLPDDVHHCILPYLPFIDVLKSYQQTCKFWWQLSAISITEVDISDIHFKHTDEVLQVLQTRFPKVKYLKIPREMVRASYEKTQFDLLVGWHDLEVVQFHVLLFAPRIETIGEFLKTFPNYRVLYLTYSTIRPNTTTHQPYLVNLDRVPSATKAKKDAESAHITHVGVNQKLCDDALFNTLAPMVANTMTHLFSSTYQGTEDVLLKLVKHLPLVTNLVSICIPDTAVPVDGIVEVLKRSPKLQKFRGHILIDHAHALAKYCPELVSIDTLIASITVEIFKIIANMEKLEELHTFRLLAPLTDKSANLKTLRVLLPNTENLMASIPHLKNLRCLNMTVEDQCIETVANHCPLLQEVKVHNKIQIATVRKWIENCPKLRYIDGTGGRIKSHRLGDGRIDAMRMREEMNEKRPTKKKKR